MSTLQETQVEEPSRRAGRSRVTDRLLNQPLRNLGVGVTAVVLGTTAAFGGLEPSSPDQTLPAVPVGQVTPVAPFDVTINKLLWVNDLPLVYPTEKGNRWLAITATVRNTSDATVGVGILAETMTVSQAEGLVNQPVPGTERVRSTYQKLIADSSDLDRLQPGLDYGVAFLYEQKASAIPTAQVGVQLIGRTWRKDSIDGDEKWFDPTVSAESLLPVTAPAPASAPAVSASANAGAATSASPDASAAPSAKPTPAVAKHAVKVRRSSSAEDDQ